MPRPASGLAPAPTLDAATPCHAFAKQGSATTSSRPPSSPAPKAKRRLHRLAEPDRLFLRHSFFALASLSFAPFLCPLSFPEPVVSPKKLSDGLYMPANAARRNAMMRLFATRTTPHAFVRHSPDMPPFPPFFSPAFPPHQGLSQSTRVRLSALARTALVSSSSSSLFLLYRRRCLCRPASARARTLPVLPPSPTTLVQAAFFLSGRR